MTLRAGTPALRTAVSFIEVPEHPNSRIKPEPTQSSDQGAL